MESENMKDKVAVILGPTAVGKTAISLQVAANLGAEIISCDSMQFYKGMDIGTDKIKPEAMVAANGKRVPHHMIDILRPDEPYTVADFQAAAVDLIREINARGSLPLLVGGTGLYISAVVEGYKFVEEAPINEAFRQARLAELAKNGPEFLHQQLAELDPVTAGKLHVKDSRRIIRALEVYYFTGEPLSRFVGNEASYDTALVGLIRPREEIYAKIDERVDEMILAGLADEVKGLLAAGYSRSLRPMCALGYKQICAFLAGEMDFEQAVFEIKRDTRRFAKRQLTWWRHKEVTWFEVNDFLDKMVLADAISCHIKKTLGI